ncbi:hypothetical protein E6C70_08615 [Glaciibacter flavus]|uniref:Uncharacterized protein n=1 Tax=Orlajensenia flava TaxID=2565934 RepID=A0A4S4FV21_9MICO|nr:hypothetical protein [Glaciibacter flavus]THG34334.1 hypothetical protein E6C70_08615 [Glaciibacter flavus]
MTRRRYDRVTHGMTSVPIRPSPVRANAAGARQGKPLASGQRIFWAYTLHVLGAILGACAGGLALWLVPRDIASRDWLIDAGDDYGATVSMAWDAGGLIVLVMASAIGVLIAALGLPVLRGHHRNPLGYVLIGLALVGLMAAVAGYCVMENERGWT